MSCRPAQNFNSRPSARGDAVAAALDALTDISIHAPPRGATCEERGSGDWQNISIHAPPRGATRSPWHPPPSARISIHAPPRGATAWRRGDYADCPISIHAPPRGATDVSSGGNDAGYFNSRPSARGDHSPTSMLSNLSISIHAPPRGATPLLFSTIVDCIISIHAPPRGATWCCIVLCNVTKFQFTPLREGRQSSSQNRHSSTPISIHAPPRGATGGIGADGRPIRTFQFTPLREGRRNVNLQRAAILISIHAPPRGATALC